MKIVLASQSPRRRKILSQFDLDLTCIPHLFNEDSVIYNNNPIEYCELISKGKAESISDKYNDSLILAADTIVVLDDKILGKPRIKEDAIAMLKSLSGRTHKVITGVTCILNNNGLNITFSDMTIVSSPFD